MHKNNNAPSETLSPHFTVPQKHSKNQATVYVSDGNSVYNSAMISPKLPSFLIVLCKRTLGNDDFDHTAAAVCAAAYILKVAFIQKILMHLSFPQTDEPYYFPELEF